MTLHPPPFLAARPRAAVVATTEVLGGPKLMSGHGCHGCAAPLSLEEDTSIPLLLLDEGTSPLRLGAGTSMLLHYVSLHFSAPALRGASSLLLDNQGACC